MSVGTVKSSGTEYVQQPRTAQTSNSTSSQPQEKSGHFEYNDSVSISEQARALAANRSTTSVLTDDRFSTRESRDAEADRYGEILKDLRSKYNEEEVMERFNSIMNAEGFELQSEINDPAKQTYNITKHGPEAGGLRNNWGFFNSKLLAMQGYTDVKQVPSSYDFTSKLYTYSNRLGIPGADGVEYSDSTWAVYNAFDITHMTETVDQWKNRNLDYLNGQTDFDLKAYVDNLTSHELDTFAVESVNSSLASPVADILKQAGIKLEKGQELSLYLNRDNSGLSVDINFGDKALKEKIQAAFDNALSRDFELINKFVSEEKSVRDYDLGTLPGAFDNGKQSVSFGQYRRFIFAGSEPSAVVMGSSLYANTTGYSYQKKVNNEFSFESDLFSVTGKNSQARYLSDPFYVEVNRAGLDLHNQYKDYLNNK